jgi:hypothetical protein
LPPPPPLVLIALKMAMLHVTTSQIFTRLEFELDLGTDVR